MYSYQKTYSRSKSPLRDPIPLPPHLKTNTFQAKILAQLGVGPKKGDATSRREDIGGRREEGEVRIRKEEEEARKSHNSNFNPNTSSNLKQSSNSNVSILLGVVEAFEEKLKKIERCAGGGDVMRRENEMIKGIVGGDGPTKGVLRILEIQKKCVGA